METKENKNWLTFRAKVIANKKYDWAFTLVISDKSKNDFKLVNKTYGSKCGLRLNFVFDITATLDDKGYIDKIIRVH